MADSKDAAKKKLLKDWIKGGELSGISTAGVQLGCMIGTMNETLATENENFKKGIPGYGPAPEVGKLCLANLQSAITRKEELDPYAQILVDKGMMGKDDVNTDRKNALNKTYGYIKLAADAGLDQRYKDSDKPAEITLNSGSTAVITPGTVFAATYIKNFVTKGTAAVSQNYDAKQIEASTENCFKQNEKLGVCSDMGIIHSEIALGKREPLEAFDVSDKSKTIKPPITPAAAKSDKRVENTTKTIRN